MRYRMCFVVDRGHLLDLRQMGNMQAKGGKGELRATDTWHIHVNVWYARCACVELVFRTSDVRVNLAQGTEQICGNRATLSEWKS